jgi:hypothetical protein
LFYCRDFIEEICLFNVTKYFVTSLASFSGKICEGKKGQAYVCRLLIAKATPIVFQNSEGQLQNSACAGVGRRGLGPIGRPRLRVHQPGHQRPGFNQLSWGDRLCGPGLRGGWGSGCSAPRSP